MIHKYKLHGYNVVLDVNSGGVHLVDDLTYDMLDNVAPPFAEEFPRSIFPDHAPIRIETKCSFQM